MKPPIRVLLLFAANADNATFSYQRGWPRQFASHPRFACTPVDLSDRRPSQRLRAHALVRLGRYDAIVVLHSVFSNACHLDGRLFDAVCAARRPKVFFIGNEYKIMPEKMAFAERLPVALLVSQSDAPAVHALYRERLGCEVIGLPNTGLDTRLFAPRVPYEDRPIDVGYRSVDAPMYLGHDERRGMAAGFQQHGERAGLRMDISLDDHRRFTEDAWSGFLNACKAQLGTEAGGDYFELTDRTRYAVTAFEAANPHASFDEVFDRFFRNYRDPVPIRIISGRNVEAAGTKTVQILFDGHYGGYFQPDVHYLALRKDFGNVDEVLRQLRDRGHCRSIAEQAYRVAVEELTYERLLDRFHDAIGRCV